MKKAIVLSSIILSAFMSMAQTNPVLHANTRVMVDSTSLLIDSSEHGTCDFKDARIVGSASKYSSGNKSKAKLIERPRGENNHSSAVFRRRSSSL